MRRTWPWSTTGYTFTKRPHEEIIAVCVEVGLAGIEAVAELCGNRSESELARLGQEYKAAGLAIDSFHLPFNAEDDIASFYETVRRGAVERMLRHLDQSAALGVRVAVQHPSTNRFSVQIEGLENYLRAIERSLRVLLPRAESLGLRIALENMLPGVEGPRLGSAPEHFTELTARLGHPALGYCLDTGHALMAGGPEGQGAFLEAMGPRLTAFHLADNAGDRDSHLAPGRGLVDWRAVFRGMAGLGYSHPACIETPPFAWGPHDAYGIVAWHQLVRETEALAAAMLTD